MPWETGSAVHAAASTKRHAGVLEVKMKQRLQHDVDTVAIGAVRHSPTHQHQHHHQPKKIRKVHKLPHLQQQQRNTNGDVPRPTLFENERQAIMDAVALPSPTRTLVNKHVDHTKHELARRQETLPPVAGAFKKRAGPHSLFPQAYQRGELPIMIETKPGGQTLRWTQEIKTLDYSKLLPLFLEGMRESTFPFSFMAREGAFQLLAFGHEYPERLLECLPRVVPALRSILELQEPRALRDALQIVQALANVPGVGPALVPYYRQLLPVLNLFKTKRRNLGDAMDFQQHKAQDLAALILDTLELLERCGGPDAFVNIKYMVPTYEDAHAT